MTSLNRSRILNETVLHGTVDPFRFRPEENFCAGGASRTLVEIQPGYSDTGVVWQEAAYAIARRLADAVGFEQIVELGCGAGRKLRLMFDGFSANILQVDFADQREAYIDGEIELPKFAFARADFEDFGDLAALESVIQSEVSTLFILADVIEHLHDPRPVLRFLRRMLRRHPSNRAIISTVDRERVDGARASNVPDNPEHVRQWTLNEFGLALLASGFAIERIGRAPQNNYDASDCNSIAELSCSPSSYSRFLVRWGLGSAEHLVVTTEHAGLLRSGGIGSYQARANEAVDLSRQLLFVGGMGLPDQWRSALGRLRIVHAAEVCGLRGATLDQILTIDEDQVLQAVEQLVFLCDQIIVVEYQDYLGIGYRVAQAKRARLLPPEVTVLAYAHGSHFYLDYAAGELDINRTPEVDVKERLSLELADEVWFPSRYLADLYIQQQGLALRRSRLQPYPIDVKRSAGFQRHRPIDTIAFFGRASAQKGFPEFVAAISSLLDRSPVSPAANRIERIVLMGVHQNEAPAMLWPGVSVEWGAWSQAGAYDKLCELAPSTLVVLPYKGDNHPLAVFDVVESGCQILAFDVAGLPEILPEEMRGDVTCPPTSAALANGIETAVLLPFWRRIEIIQSLQRLLHEKYREVTRHYRLAVSSLAEARLGEIHANASLAAQLNGEANLSVIVPSLNGPAEYLSDVSRGIRCSLVRPRHVYFIDDASEEHNGRVIETAAQSLSDIPTTVIRNQLNLGLAASRNVGLAVVTTAYVCAHDDDNIVRNGFFSRACRILDENPDVAAVTTWSKTFQDGEDWMRFNPSAYAYRPLGQDLGLGLVNNVFGDALAVYRCEALRRIGGWDDKSRATWEDWALFLRLTAVGEKVWVIPKEMTLYRARANSMARTYATFPGRLRHARALAPLPMVHSLSVIRAACFRPLQPSFVPVHGTPAELELARSRLRGVEAELAAMTNSTSWKMTFPLRVLLESAPASFRSAMRSVAKVAWLLVTLQFRRLSRAARRLATQLSTD
jgi:glycosyltransferase involved in cell wall biosynthesis/GT2 family glycosyltransferase